MTLQEKKERRKLIFGGIILEAANAILFLSIWLMNTYDEVAIEQFIFHMKASAAGTDSSITISAVTVIGGCSVLLTALEIFLYILLSGRGKKKLAESPRYLKYCSGKFCCFLYRKALPISLCLLIASSAVFLTRMKAFAYVGNIATKSDFFEENYADPATQKLTFPEEKRNLIFIFLESLENTYADPESAEIITDNLIPELSKLADENINFSHNNGLGGALSYSGSTWTAAALVAQTAGITVRAPLTAEKFDEENSFFPEIVTLGDILEKEGYNQTLLFGSDAQFASRDIYFTEHGNYNIVDLVSLRNEGRLPADYHEWWGFEDQKLFQFAKEEITKLADADKPFNFTMLTADTHFPDGYVCPLCEEEYEEQYSNVLSCSSKQIYAFIEWLSEQAFYENTTIILSGDHLTMDPDFLKTVDKDYVRTNYNCIINAAVEPVKEKNREFACFDIFPTTLAAMGVEIEDERLGLGVNLFSDKETLTEKYGYEFVNEELQKTSKYYMEKIYSQNR